MSKKIIPTLLSDEELMNALDSAGEAAPETEEILEHNNDVIPFLSHYKIEPGEMAVNKKLLYRLYKQYYSKDPLSSRQFHYLVGQFLGYYYNYSGGFYRINQDQFKLSAYMFKEHRKKTIDKTKSNAYRKHFEAFLERKEIEKSSKYIEGYILHDIYKQYCKEIGLTTPKLGRDNFHKMCKLFFKHKRNGDSRVNMYAVETKLTKEEIDAIKAGRG